MRRVVLALTIASMLVAAPAAHALDLVPPSASTDDRAATVSWEIVGGDTDLAHPMEEEALRRRDLGMPSVTVADTIRRTVRVATEPGVSFDWPASLVVGADLNGLTISAIRDEPARVDAQGRIVSIRILELEPFLPGDFELGPFDFTIQREGENAVDTLTLPSMTVSIAPLLPDEPNPELAGPKDVVDPPSESASGVRPWIIVGSIVLVAFAALGGAGIAVLTRRIRETEVSPARRALAALAMLEERVRGESGVGRRPSNQEAYSDLSSALRGYIEDRFEYRASARTTEEFLRDASERRGGLSDDAAQRLRGVLEACDEVKFGGVEPGMGAAGRAIEEARAFVNDFGDADEGTA